MADALQQGCDLVVTFGGLQSNHARATALAARQVGLPTHLVALCSTETVRNRGGREESVGRRKG